jgi:hypothetical protein
MLRLKEWNEVLDYAEKAKEELVNKGINVKVKPYLMYNNEKGVYFVIYDKNGKEFARYASGVHDTVEKYKKYINYYKEFIIEECA